jgi:hypothetical protein
MAKLGHLKPYTLHRYRRSYEPSSHRTRVDPYRTYAR